MANAKQTAKDRVGRLSEGRCPIHGTPMPQIDCDVVDGSHVYVVACPRKDCDIEATQTEAGGPSTLRTAWLYLVQPTPVS